MVMRRERPIPQPLVSRCVEYPGVMTRQGVPHVPVDRPHVPVDRSIHRPNLRVLRSHLRVLRSHSAKAIENPLRSVGNLPISLPCVCLAAGMNRGWNDAVAPTYTEFYAFMGDNHAVSCEF